METHNTREWEERFEDLAAINYNLYLAGTVRRADTGEDWTVEQAEEEIKDFIHQELQKARASWLREEIVKLEGMKKEERQVDYDGTGLYEGGFNSALEYILDRYLSELDQPDALTK